MYRVVIDGFKTREAALEFAAWYASSGWESADEWWERRIARSREDQNLGEPPVATLPEGAFARATGNDFHLTVEN